MGKVVGGIWRRLFYSTTSTTKLYTTPLQNHKSTTKTLTLMGTLLQKLEVLDTKDPQLGNNIALAET